MKVWIITSGEPIPSQEERPHRAGILSAMLADKGNNVVWWTTTFDHQSKEYLYDINAEVKLDNNYSRFFLHSNTSYKKNISLNRIKNHQQVAINFEIESRKKETPDVIFCSFPTIDLSFSATKYAKEFNVPIVIDVRDLWPDIFFNPFPRALYPFIKIGLNNYIKQTKFIFKNCTSITGVSKKYLEFGLQYGNRKKTNQDKVFPLGYDSEGKNNIILKDNEFDTLGIDSRKINIWFVGTFGKTYDLSTVIKAARLIEKETKNINFIFTGDGENMSKWKEESKELGNVVFTGWVGKRELHYISLNSSIGLMAYSKGAPQGLPNKIYEYMASGLPILSSLQSETKELLENEKIGITYEPNNFENLYSKINLLTKDSNLLNEMKTKSKKVFKEKYDSSIVYEGLVKYLNQLSK